MMCSALYSGLLDQCVSFTGAAADDSSQPCSRGRVGGRGTIFTMGGHYLPANSVLGGQYSLVNSVLGGQYSLVNNVEGDIFGGDTVQYDTILFC